MRDVSDLFNDLKNGTLLAVSYAKPDGTMDGHSASSKFDLFEAFAKKHHRVCPIQPRAVEEHGDLRHRGRGR
jgi:hypothetical protein